MDHHQQRFRDRGKMFLALLAMAALYLVLRAAMS